MHACDRVVGIRDMPAFRASETGPCRTEHQPPATSFTWKRPIGHRQVVVGFLATSLSKSAHLGILGEPSVKGAVHLTSY